MNRNLFLTLFLGVLMGALDIAILGPALPAIRGEFAASAVASSWLVTIYVLTNLVGTPLLGALSDRQGRGRAYRVSVALFALGSLGVVLAPGIGWLLVARALQGFGSGGIFPVASATIGDVVSRQKQGRMLGAIGATFGLAFLIGPPLGAAVLSFADWRWIFAANLPLSVLLLAMSLKSMPTVKPSSHGPIDLVGIGLLSLALVTLALSMSMGRLLAPPLLAGLIVTGIASLGLLTAWERKNPRPFLPPRLLGRRAVVLPLLLGVGAGLGEVGTMFLPDHAVRSLGVTPSQAGFLLTALVLALLVGSPLAGRLTDRFGARPILVAGAFLQTAGLAVFALTPHPVAMTWHIGGALLGLGLAALLGGPARLALLHATPAGQRTMAQSLLSVAHAVGQISTAALLGGLAHPASPDTAPSLTTAFAVSAIISTFLVPLAYFLPAGIRRKAKAS
ncbi:MAG: MFS transporter [Fibrobacteria bacterium]|nr:MFS transporter [Fibrobacteria bacterium]